MAQSAGAAEYIGSISAEGEDSSNACPRYDTKQSDGKVPVMLKAWGMWRKPSLSSLPGPYFPGVVTPDWVLSMGRAEVFDI